MNNILYDKSYFIKKFTAIPDEKWTIKDFNDESNGACCALGHCGVRYFVSVHDLPEAYELQKLLSTKTGQINDGEDKNYQQSTPKARILAALADLPD